MCRYEQLSLPARPDASRRARAWLASHLAAWDLAELTDDLQLCLSELVTNVVVHAGTPAELTLAVAGGLLEVSVGDHDPRPAYPRDAPSDPFGEGGRGVSLVDQLADEWGVVYEPPGKQVWLRRHLPDTWRPVPPCACAASHGGARRYCASGQAVSITDAS